MLDDVVPMLAVNLTTDKDVEVRNKFFVLLSQLLLNAENTVNSENRYEVLHVTLNVPLVPSRPSKSVIRQVSKRIYRRHS